MSDADVKEYERIWKGIEKCVKQCLVDEYGCLEEMLYRYNWYPVHVHCRAIIEKHMKPLGVTDPHMFDKAVCWHAVSTGLDRDPKWRGICAFFFAAAMEIVMVERENDKFKKIRVGGESAGSSLHDLLRRLLHSHDDLHRKHDELIVSNSNLHQTVNEMRDKISNSNNANMFANHQVHINIPQQAAGPSGGGVGDIDLEKILELLMGHAREKNAAQSSAYGRESGPQGNVYERDAQSGWDSWNPEFVYQQKKSKGSPPAYTTKSGPQGNVSDRDPPQGNVSDRDPLGFKFEV